MSKYFVINKKQKDLGYEIGAEWYVQNGGYAIIDDAPGQAASLILGPDTAKLMRPHVICVTRNTTAKFHDIDYIRLWAERKA